MIHEDDRRILEDWPEAKIITAKKDCILGNHYHKIKTEMFILTEGSARLIINTLVGPVGKQMKVGHTYIIHPGTRHTFHMANGSVLIGLCSHAFDPTDDYK